MVVTNLLLTKILWYKVNIRILYHNGDCAKKKFANLHFLVTSPAGCRIVKVVLPIEFDLFNVLVDPCHFSTCVNPICRRHEFLVT